MADFGVKHQEESELSIVAQPVSQHAQWPAQQSTPWPNNYPAPGPNNYPAPGPQYHQPQWPQQQRPPGYPQPAYSPPPQMGTSSQSMSTNNTIIITRQPGASGPTPPRNWTSGLCDCCSDPGTCCMAYWCPCCLQISVAQDMGESCCAACMYASCGAMSLFGLRVYLRGRENIQGSLCDDFYKAGCCTICYCCVLAQIAREVKNVKKSRGYF